MPVEKLNLQNSPNDYPSEKEWQEWKKSYRQQLKKEKKELSEQLTETLEAIKNTSDAESILYSKQYIEWLKSKIEQIEKQLQAMDYPLDEVKEIEYSPDLKMRFVYEKHSLDHNPDVVRGELTGYFVEFARIKDDKSRFALVGEKYSQEEFRQCFPDDHYRNIIEASLFNGIQLYIIDVVGDKFYAIKKVEDNKRNQFEKINGVINIISGLIASYMLKNAFDNKKKHSEVKIFRRDFLKKSLRYGTLGLLLTSEVPILLDLYQKVYFMKDEKQKQRDALIGFYVKITEEFGLENLGLTFRNVLWAQKVMTVHKKNRQRGYYGFQCGAAHVGVEKMLTLDDETRLKIIKEIYNSIDKERRPEPRELALITKFTFDKKEDVWQEKNHLDNSIMKCLK